MRLGSYNSSFKKNSTLISIYRKNKINERHRHRYEVNYNYLDVIEKSGIITGLSPDKKFS